MYEFAIIWDWLAFAVRWLHVITGIAWIGSSFYFVALSVGPLLGSFITEPAAMTLLAIVLKRRYFDRGIGSRLAYATLGLLFVNVSIGGTLTHFAAPPVLMVAGQSLQVFYQIPFAMVQLIQAIIVICVAASEFFINYRLRLVG